MPIRERIDEWGTVWFWTGKDDDTSPLICVNNVKPYIFATSLAVQCLDFRALVAERIR